MGVINKKMYLPTFKFIILLIVLFFVYFTSTAVPPICLLLSINRDFRDHHE